MHEERAIAACSKMFFPTSKHARTHFTGAVKGEDCPDVSRSSSAHETKQVNKEEPGGSATASQPSTRQENSEQHEQKGHGAKRSAEVTPQKASAKKAKKGEGGQSGSPQVKKKGPMDSFLIKNSA